MIDAMALIKNGNKKQREAYEAIQSLGILHDFSSYTPLLCGTIPLDIDHDQSDLDMVLRAEDLTELARELKEKYGEYEAFSQKRVAARGNEVLVTNFFFQGFEFELYAQNERTEEQYGYLHMVVEYKVLKDHPEWKQLIREKKKKGTKTEPAFCEMLELEGDPYEELIQYGRKKAYI